MATTTKISALCEVHPQLRLANLYVKMPPAEGADLGLVTVKENCITFPSVRFTFPAKVKLLDQCNIQPTVVGSDIHLRLPCGVPEGKASGSGSVEVIDFTSLTSGFTNQLRMHVPIPKKFYRITCLECQSVLIDNAQFERVLPLPRCSWSEAASDWYCHLHSEDEEATRKLLSRPGDCLYSSCYHSLDSSLFTHGTLQSSVTHFHCCSVCQSPIALGNEGRLNVWCHSVLWSVREVLSDVSWTSIPSVTPLEAFYYALYDALEEEKSFFGRKLAFRDPSSGSSLLLWFVGDNGFTLEGTEQSSVVELKPSHLHRVLFKSTDSPGSSSGPNKLSDISEYQVSVGMLDAVLEVLRRSSQRLPLNYRLAAGFSIGYLPLMVDA